MRRLTALGLIWLPVALAAVVAIRVWGSGGAIQVGRFAAEDHHQVQNGMAGALRRLKAGDYAALLALWGLCFAYGFFHVAGPGHGKLDIGGYGKRRRVPMGRLAGLAVGFGLAQAVSAVIPVYAVLFLLGWTREQMQRLADTTMSHISNAAHRRDRALAVVARVPGALAFATQARADSGSRPQRAGPAAG